ncbi:ribosomal RNA small subunit methyltransferase A [Candidatus Bathyarchaeota archaeon]|nr:MAG: ribosomal RNA small subunit methyltransferase A [Candidatus Bathyarchaeota archaeon]
MIPIKKVKAILRSYGLKPKKKLGQHFLLDERLMERLADHAQLSERDVVLDAGAGLGFLTEVLARRSGKVLAVEIDRGLVRALRDRLAGYQNVRIIEGDVLKVPLPSFNKTVSTPPYNIISRLIFWLLDRPGLDVAVLVVQEELARRLVAEPNTDDYGRLTVTAYYRADVEVLEPVPRDRFWPQPDVDSVAVKFIKRPAPFKVLDEDLFLALVRGLFSHRNKMVRRALRLALAALGMDEQDARKLAEGAPHATRRVRELMPEDLAEIANYVSEQMKQAPT